jgi:hypothetical protein
VPKPPAPKVTYLFDELKAYDNSNKNIIVENQSFKMLGDECIKGWRFYTDLAPSGATAFYNLRGQYKTVKGVLGHIDGTNRDGIGTLSIYLDDKLYKEYPLTSDMLPTELNSV